VYFLPVECSELVRKIAPTLLGLASRDPGYIEGLWCAFIFQSTPFVQADWLTHPPKYSLTDAQMIRKRRMSQDCFCYYAEYRVEHFGFFLVAKKI